MEKKVFICDSCKKQVKTLNCEICGKDLCEDCAYKIKVECNVGGDLFNIPVCKDCYNIKYYKGVGWEDLKKLFTNTLKKMIILKGLGDKEGN